MTDTLQALLGWIEVHPGWAQFLIFAVALADAILIVGAFVPAGIILFGMGALVALGTLDLGAAILLAAGGAVAGDGLSFWLGRRYHEQLFEWRLFRKYPDLIRNGRRFFERHGGKSVVLARFLGPMRAITPALAGASSMNVWLFLLVDSAAALVWAVTYVTPGVVFGASLGLASEVAGRLAVLLLALIVLLWLGLWVTLFSMRQVQAHAERWVGGLLDWSRRHRRLGLFGAALADPDYPETPVLALLAVILLAVGVGCVYLLATPSLHPYPLQLDAVAFQTMRDLHTPWGIALAEAMLQLGEWTVYGPVALVAFAALLARRNVRAAAHWIAALGFGLLLSVGLYAIPTVPPPYLFFGLPAQPEFNERDLVLATVIYSFIPVLIGTDRTPAARAVFYGTSSVLLLLILLARLYLGAQWYSLALLGLIIGVVWAALLGLGYRRHRPERVSRSLLLPVITTFIIAVGIQWSAERPLQRSAAPQVPIGVLPAKTWLENGSPALAHQRQDIAGRPKQPFNLQWAGDLPVIEAQLRAAGWQDATRFSGINVLRWLTASSEVSQLPLLPQVHAGTHQALNLRLPIDEQSQYLLRLWPSGYQLDDGAPIWIGSIARQTARSYYRVFRYPVAHADPLPLPTLFGLVPAPQVRLGGSVWRLRS